MIRTSRSIMTNKDTNFTFIDLFAGIGGFHRAFHDLGGSCVFASEIDNFARQTYEANYKAISPDLFKNDNFNTDITKIDPSLIPNFDLLCAGFPCQPFSQAGFKKGFRDHRGNLFFYIADIISAKKPKAYFLENVRGLFTHDNGNTFKAIHDILHNELGYSVYHKIIRASDYGLPQLRPRTFIIGFKDDEVLGNFDFPPKKPLKYTMSDILNGECDRDIGFTLRVGGRGSPIKDRRNWDSYMVDRKVLQIGPEHGLKMQGFPNDFVFPVSKSQAMKQLGNSVAVDAIKECGKSLIKYMNFLHGKKKTK